MYTEILSKKESLQAQSPLSPSIEQKITDLNKTDWLYGELSLRGEGTGLTKGDAAQMAQGLMVGAASLRECSFAEHFQRGWDLICGWLKLEHQLDKKMLLEFYGVFVEDEPVFRRANLSLPDFRFTPMDKFRVEDEINRLLREVYQSGDNTLTNAAKLHCRVLDICPFEGYNDTIARFAMNYYLLEQGFPAVALGYSREEYVDTMKKCLQEKREGVFLMALERAMYNKLEVLLQVVEEDKEDCKDETEA